MNHKTRLMGFLITAVCTLTAARPLLGAVEPSDETGCQALAGIRNLTLIQTVLRPEKDGIPSYCYARGIISPAIHYHVQLPLLENWNGRLLNIGDGAKDGDLDFADQRLAQGYAVANSNMGHDAGAEAGASFGYNNRQSEIDFGYRAVHLTAEASRTLVSAYYEEEPAYSYFEGCSSGGREAFMEAQRFPEDFDGIVAGAPAIFYQRANANHVWMLQRIYRNNLAGNLAYDQDGDGVPESLTKMEILANAVMNKCDGLDGITDGVIDDPLACDFDVDVDLAGKKCPGNVDGDTCFTQEQSQIIKDIYRGSTDSNGVQVFSGKTLGTERAWADGLFPHAGNNMSPARLGTAERPGTAADHMNYLFYEEDPGVTLPSFTDLSQVPDKTGHPPEFAWWEFDIDDVTSGKGDLMMSITEATDPDLNRFLVGNNGKMIVYHGWADAWANPEPTVNYYREVVTTTFGGDVSAARENIRLFMVPGMDHCRGGPGPNTWDKLAPLVAWVEKGKAPDHLMATHSSDGKVDNERPLCPYPERAIYTGPAGGRSDRRNWVGQNFTCR
ncbi:MAG: tannase/feruloyl esterase family alpha/beta hydrolase [Acidobacteriota bacterium]